MTALDWLDPSLVLLNADVTDVEALASVAAGLLESEGGLEPSVTTPLLTELLCERNGSVGRGVALPHVSAPAFERTRLLLVTTAEPLDLATVDGQAPDVFFFLLSVPERSQQHLGLLAHLVRLVDDDVLLEALREADEPQRALDVIGQAEQKREVARTPTGLGPTSPNVLVMITIRGEQPVDELLVELVELELTSAVVVEAQGLREALAREVPLFAGFADIFGDPGGRRVVMVETATRRVQALLATLKRICIDHGVDDVWLAAVPLHAQWHYRADQDEDPGGAGGH